MTRLEESKQEEHIYPDSTFWIEAILFNGMNEAQMHEAEKTALDSQLFKIILYHTQQQLIFMG